MYKTQVVDFFKTQVGVAELLSLSQASVSKWGKIIPEKQALRLEKLTNGALKYNPALYSAREANKALN